MKKFFTLLLAVISTMTAFAQTEPAIELQAEVDGNTRTFTIGLGVEGTVQIDWGNGEKVTSEVIPAFDGWNQVDVSGSVSGEGKVKIYGDNIVYFSRRLQALPTYRHRVQPHRRYILLMALR